MYTKYNVAEVLFSRKGYMKANSREREKILKDWAFPGYAAFQCLPTVNTSLCLNYLYVH